MDATSEQVPVLVFAAGRHHRRWRAGFLLCTAAVFALFAASFAMTRPQGTWAVILEMVFIATAVFSLRAATAVWLHAPFARVLLYTDKIVEYAYAKYPIEILFADIEQIILDGGCVVVAVRAALPLPYCHTICLNHFQSLAEVKRFVATASELLASYKQGTASATPGNE